MTCIGCRHVWNRNRIESWDACITEMYQHGTYCEFLILSRSSIYVLVGKNKQGRRFVCVPDWNAALWVFDLDDLIFNKREFMKVMKNDVDGITVAFALQKLIDVLP